MQQTLNSLITSKQLQRGAQVRFAASRIVGPPLEGIVEHVTPGYLVLSFVHTSERRALLGASVRMDLETPASFVELQFEVVQEQIVWPVTLIGMTPSSVNVRIKQGAPLKKPDFIINVPYKVMGAKPSEERGEGVVLELSLDKVVLGTDGYLAKGDFVHLSFLIPRTKNQVVAMARVTEKQFIDGSTVVTLEFTDMEERHRKTLQEYYQKL